MVQCNIVSTEITASEVRLKNEYETALAAVREKEEADFFQSLEFYGRLHSGS